MLLWLAVSARRVRRRFFVARILCGASCGLWMPSSTLPHLFMPARRRRWSPGR